MSGPAGHTKRGLEPAFPLWVPESQCPPDYGLTKRELFAAMVMQGIASQDDVAYPNQEARQSAIKYCAKAAVEWADALLEALTDEERV